MAGIKKLLFVDTNIWLDFYRPRQSDVALKLLGQLEGIKDRIIVTHVLEMEYKRHRQSAILEGLDELKAPPKLATLGIFSEAQAARMIERHRAEIEKRLGRLRKRLQRALVDPALHDPVYQTCQRIFGRESKLVLGIDSDRRLKQVIREKAIRRFYLGCPPRKPGETSIGDAINWEWMVHCAEKNDAELVILTRDQDYGPRFGQTLLLNDHLNQEFRERVSQKREVLLYSSAALALKHFHVRVSKEVVKDELAFISSTTPSVTQTASRPTPKRDLLDLFRQFTEGVDDTISRSEFDWLDDGAPTSVAEPEDFPLVHPPEDEAPPPPDEELPPPPRDDDDWLRKV